LVPLTHCTWPLLQIPEIIQIKTCGVTNLPQSRVTRSQLKRELT
jgi:hypothetical protein